MKCFNELSPIFSHGDKFSIAGDSRHNTIQDGILENKLTAIFFNQSIASDYTSRLSPQGNMEGVSLFTKS